MVTLSPGAVAPQRAVPGRRFKDAIQEHCRTVLRRLGWPNIGSGQTLRAIAVTSCYSGEGVSTVAAELAAAAASGDQRILLVDANLARPAVHRIFAVERTSGLAEAVLQGSELTDCIRPSSIANLSLLTAGGPQQRGTDVYDSGSLAAVLKAVREEFDLALIDLPAVGEASSAIRLAGLCDGVLLVVESERVRREVARRASEQLAQANAVLLGAVLNKRRRHVPDWLYRTL